MHMVCCNKGSLQVLEMNPDAEDIALCMSTVAIFFPSTGMAMHVWITKKSESTFHQVPTP